MVEANACLIIAFEVIFLIQLQEGSYPSKVISIFDTSLCGIVAIGNGYLGIFHMWLRCKGFTTYLYIIDKRRKNIGKVIQDPQKNKDMDFNAITTETQKTEFKLRTTPNKSLIDELRHSEDFIGKKMNWSQEIIATNYEANSLYDKDIIR